MSTVLPTTDEVYQTIVGELKVRMPGVPVKELPCARDLWACYADRYLGEWIPVASEDEVNKYDPDGEARPARWSLDRRTQFDGHLHVRGKLRFVVDHSRDEQWNSVQDHARILAEQIAVIGEVHEVILVRETDTDVPFGSTVHVMLLAHVESRFRDHIRMDERGVPWLTDTVIKVREIVLDYLGYGWSVLHIFHQHYNSPPLEKIHAALTYFDNNRSAMLKEIEEMERYVEEMFQKMGQPPFVQKLLARRN